MAAAGAQHPDGDPFAKEKAPMSLLDRLEASARAEHPELATDLPGQDQADTSMRGQTGRDDSTLTSDNETQDDSGSDDESKEQGAGDQDKQEDSSDDDSDSDSETDSVALDDEQRKDQESGGAAATNGAQGAPADGQPVAEGSKDAKDVPTDGEPKKKRKRKPRSPSPAPRPPPKPQTTIHLDIAMPAHPPKGGLMINIRALASDTGQLVENPEPQDDDPPSADDDQGKEKQGKEAQPALSESTAAVLGRSAVANMVKPKKRKRRILDRDEGYDKEDPFVDDSELHLDLVKTCGVPEQEGFFVCSGELPLLQSGKRTRKGEGAPRKRTKTSTNTATADTATIPPLPGKETPLPSNPNASGVVDLTGVDDDDSPHGAASPAGLSSSKANAKVRRPVAANGFMDASHTASPGASASPAPKTDDKSDEPLKPLDPIIEKMIEDFKPLVAKESFVPKNKFPEALKPPLFEMGLTALTTRDFDQSLFPVLTTILPYNKYTITKLVKRSIYPQRVEKINEQLDQQVQRLQDAVNERLPALQAQYDSDHAEWQRKHAQWVAENPDVAATSTQSQEGEEPQLRPGEPVEPSRKFKFDDSMKQCLFEIITLDSELVRLQAEKIELEKGTEKAPTEQTARKRLYSKLVSFWPDNWMTTTMLSREWSVVKKKFSS